MPVNPYGLVAMNGGSYAWPRAGDWHDLNTQPNVGPYARGLRWRDPQTVIYSHVTDANRLEQLDLDSGVVSVVGDYFTQLVAGGGQWATFSNQGYRDSHGTTGHWWFPQSVDTLTGDICVTRDDTGRDLYVWDGLTLEFIMPGLGFGTSFTNGTLVIWIDQTWYHWTRAGGLHQIGRLGTVLPGAQWCYGWNLGWYPATAAQVIWPDWDPAHAVVICQGQDNFNATIYRETASSPLVTVVGASGPGETPGQQQVFAVNLDTQTVNGVPWTILDLTSAPPVVVPTFPPARLSCVPFDGSDTAPRIIGPHEPAGGDVRYVLWTTTTGESSQPAVSAAAGIGCSVLAYVDAPLFSVPPIVPLEVMGVQCYPTAGESRADTFGRLNANVRWARLAGRPFALVTPLYTGSGAWDLQLVLDINRWAWDQGVDVVPYGIIRPPHYSALQECLDRMLVAALNNHLSPVEDEMLVLKRSRLSMPSTNFPGRILCQMNNGEFLHVDPATMGVFQSPSDDDKAAWITTAGSGAARLEIEAYFIEAKVDEKA